jgi:hypothetical protein
MMVVQASQSIKQDPLSKTANTKRAGRVVQMEEHLHSKHKAPSSTLPVPPKKECYLSKLW